MKKLVTPLFLLLCCSVAQAQVWTGASNDSWTNPANWNPATVPSSGSSVTIPNGLVTYPTLSGNVVIAGLSMGTGSALHLGGFAFTNNGNVSLQTATIDGGGSFTVAGASSVNISSSSFTTTTAITNYTGASTIYNNTFTGNTTISDAPAQSNGTNYIDGNLFTGNLNLTHASTTADMYQGFGAAGAGDRVTGNCTITLSGGGTFYAAYSEDLRVDGNLTINRTASGSTNLFRNVGLGSGSLIGGNFSYTNNAGGDFSLNGANSATLPVAGTVTISSASTGGFQMFRVKNATGGGTVSAANSSSLFVQGDTLTATVNFTAYTGSAQFYNNSFTGTTTLSDVAAQNSGINYTDGNLFNGNLSITHASSTADMYMGYGSAGNGDRVTGNCTITLSGAGAFYAAYSEALRVDGNLTVNRTASGVTNLYRNIGPGSISYVGGNFSYTNNAGGDFYFNTSNTTTLPIAGTVSITSAATGIFQLYRVKNATAGGTVSVANSSSLFIQGDTLIANTIGFTDYSGSAQFYNNSFTGSTTLSDIAAQNSGVNYTDGNLFNGNLSVTHASSGSDMDMGYGLAGNGDRVTGNCTFNLTGNGSFYAAYSEDLRVDGNLTVNRTASGITNLYRGLGGGGSTGNSLIGGNFSYTNTAGGDFFFNTNNAVTLPVAGTVSISSTSTGAFQLCHLKNATPGGSVSVANSSSLFVSSDTLTATTIGFTAYSGFAQFYNNSFTGTTTLSDIAAQNSGLNYTDGNLFNGDLTVTHASTSADMLMGFGLAGNGDRVTGNCTFNLTGAGSFYAAYNEDLWVDGNLTVNRVAPGLTFLYRAVGTGSSSGNSLIGGNFTYTNTAGGDFALNNSNIATMPVGGTINVNSTSLGYFHMYRTKGATPGGTLAMANSVDVDLRGDTLRGALNITAYRGQLQVYNNSITGATVITDIAAQGSGINYIDGNLFDGRFTLVHNSTTASVYDGFGGSSATGNVVTGRDSLVNIAGATSLFVGNTHPHRADSSIFFNAPSGITVGSIVFGGSTPGTLRSLGAQPLSIPSATLAKTGSAVLTLESPMTLTNTFTFTSGYLASTAANPLNFANGAVQSGAGDASYVTGPVTKTGAQAFTFPLGSGGRYSPAGISAPAQTTDVFSAQYYPVPPNSAGYNAAQHDASINHISSREYWTIDRVAGASNVFVTLGYNQQSSGQVTNMSQLTVAHWYGNSWHDEGNGGTTGTNAAGTLTSSNSISTFSPFTLASTTLANPLPIVLTDFSAQRAGKTVDLSWTVQLERDVTGYDLQRSPDGDRWSDIGSVAAAGAHSYRYTDASPLADKNYYRLRINNTGSAADYSAVRTVVMDGTDGGEIAVYPNPVTALLHLSGSIRTATLSDATGRTVFTGTGDIDMQAMPAGLYLLRVTKMDGEVEAVKVTKR